MFGFIEVGKGLVPAACELSRISAQDPLPCHPRSLPLWFQPQVSVPLCLEKGSKQRFFGERVCVQRPVGKAGGPSKTAGWIRECRAQIGAGTCLSTCHSHTHATLGPSEGFHASLSILAPPGWVLLPIFGFERLASGLVQASAALASSFFFVGAGYMPGQLSAGEIIRVLWSHTQAPHHTPRNQSLLEMLPKHTLQPAEIIGHANFPRGPVAKTP